MKRVFSIIAIVTLMLSALALTACQSGPKDYSDSKYVGIWKFDSIAMGDESGTFEDEYLMTLNADGTGTLASAEETSSFTWEPTSDGFKTKGDVKLTFKDDGDKIVTKMLGADLIFVREE